MVAASFFALSIRKKTLSFRALSRTGIFILLTLSAYVPVRAAEPWRAIKAQELAATKPKVDPNAHAEITEMRIEINDTSPREAETKVYVRVKVYDEAGVDAALAVQLPFCGTEELKDIHARVTKPDGTSVELSPKDIYERVVVKTGDLRVKQKSFAAPALVPGGILEYRYLVLSDPLNEIFMTFQRSLPTWVVLYVIIPSPDKSLRYNCLGFGYPQDALDKALQSPARIFAQTNVPAYQDEPFQPPEMNVRLGALFYYSSAHVDKTTDDLDRYAMDLYKKFTSVTKPGSAIKTALAGIIAIQDSDEVKLTKLYRFCCEKITRIDPLKTRASAKRTLHQAEPAETLAKQQGTAKEIKLAFAALARAAGFEVNLAACNNRSLLLFSPNIRDSIMFPDQVISVKLNGEWLFFDPGKPFLPFATLHWNNTDTGTMIATNKKPTIGNITGQSAAASTQTRRATFRLSEDGTLEGRVMVEYSGLWDTELKTNFHDDSDEARIKKIETQITLRLDLAEVSDIKISNADSTTENLRISYHLKCPGFADRTNSRLILQPAIFQKGQPLLFEAETRKTDIHFDYRYTAQDDIVIELPPNYVLEESSAPTQLDLGDLGSYEAQIGVARTGKKLAYHRKLAINKVYIPQAQYEATRTAFEQINTRDSHLLSLKHAEPPAAAPTYPTATPTPVP